MTSGPAVTSGDQPTFDPASVRAVVFDIGGVFTYPHYRDVEVMLDRLGVNRPTDMAIYRHAHHRGVYALSTAQVPVDEASYDFWLVYDRAYADALGVADHAVDEFRVAIRSSWDWPHEENIAAFHRLAASGMPVAIVSNNDGTAPEQMRQHGVCQVLEGGPLPRVHAIIDSSLVGVAKPHPAIMAPAIHALNVAPEHILYVGDTVHADVVGATAAGMQAVQLDPFDDHAEFAHSRAVDVADVIARLPLDHS